MNTNLHDSQRRYRNFNDQRNEKEMYIFSLYISREKGDHYYILNTAQGSFFPLESYSKKTLRKMSRKALENTNEMCSCPLGIL